MDYERIAEASRVALGDQTRLQIIHILSKEPVSVGGSWNALAVPSLRSRTTLR